MEDKIMDGKVILLFVSVIAVGMFVLPSTFALYGGQHTFVNGSQVDCAKCHNTQNDMIYAGLNSTDEGGARPHATFTCKDCHYDDTAGYNVTITGDEGSATLTTAHAAGVGINCIGCHSYPSQGFGSGMGYNISTKDYNATSGWGVNVSRELMEEGAAHKFLTFNTTYGRTGGIDDKDLVCVACHTEVNVDLVNTSLTNYNMTPTTGDLNITIEGGGDGDWMYTGNNTNSQ